PEKGHRHDRVANDGKTESSRTNQSHLNLPRVFPRGDRKASVNSHGLPRSRPAYPASHRAPLRSLQSYPRAEGAIWPPYMSTEQVTRHSAQPLSTSTSVVPCNAAHEGDSPDRSQPAVRQTRLRDLTSTWRRQFRGPYLPLAHKVKCDQRTDCSGAS